MYFESDLGNFLVIVMTTTIFTKQSIKDWACP